jgi:integrase/recombinase XerD
LRGYSTNTIVSYRDAFKLLICYFRDERSIPPDKLTLEQVDAGAVIEFLAWLHVSRHNSASTRNQRLAAIDSFFSWMQSQDPARMACYQDILAIPATKHDQPAVAHLGVEQTRQLLALPDRSTRAGRRDATLLATLYDTAGRVQELADLTVRDIRLDDPAMAALTGKGHKTRHVPIDANTTALLAAYLSERQLDSLGHDDHPLFFNQHRYKLTRGGIAWILRKYQAQATDPAIANARLSPHVLRHSRAMHLTTPVFRCPTSVTSSAISISPLPRSTHGHPPRPNAKHSKPSTPTSSPPTLPNGTKTPNCSAGSPTSNRPGLCAASGRRHRLYRRQPPSPTHNPALLIGVRGLAVVGEPVHALRVRCVDGEDVPRDPVRALLR